MAATDLLTRDTQKVMRIIFLHILHDTAFPILILITLYFAEPDFAFLHLIHLNCLCQVLWLFSSPPF